MANVKITELTNLTDPSTTDVMPVVDVDADVTKKVSVGEVVGKITGDVEVATDGTATISELPVSKLQDGTARQLLQTNAAGTGVEWTSNVDVPGTLDVTGAAAFNSTGRFIGDVTLDSTLIFEGSTADGFETTLTVVDPTADRAITLPDVTGTVITTGDTGTVTSTIIADGTIVNADVNASAAIAGTKIDPDFGGQTVETTGVINAGSGTEAAPAVTVGTTDNGLYSPGADQVAISTNGTQRLLIEADGDINIDSGGVFYDATNNRLAIGNTSPSEMLTIGTSAAGGNIRLNSSSAGNNGLIRFYDTANAEKMQIAANTTQATILAAGVPLRFVVGGSEAARIDTSQRLLVGTSSQSGGSLLQVNDDRIRIASSKTPASASDTGTAGEICWDSSYIYVCTATDTWKRAALSTW